MIESGIKSLIESGNALWEYNAMKGALMYNQVSDLVYTRVWDLVGDRVTDRVNTRVYYRIKD